jgi:hypothetical protein
MDHTAWLAGTGWGCSVRTLAWWWQLLVALCVVACLVFLCLCIYTDPGMLSRSSTVDPAISALEAGQGDALPNNGVTIHKDFATMQWVSSRTSCHVLHRADPNVFTTESPLHLAFFSALFCLFAKFTIQWRTHCPCHSQFQRQALALAL